MAPARCGILGSGTRTTRHVPDLCAESKRLAWLRPVSESPVDADKCAYAPGWWRRSASPPACLRTRDGDLQTETRYGDRDGAPEGGRVSDEGRLVAGRYRIVQRIGTGAMGAVWQAQDEVLHRTVAIKQLLLQPGLDPNEAEDAKQRTMREGRIAARLHHPNAISVFDATTDDNGHPCLIMEFLPSTSLAAVLQDRKTLPPLEVARIGAQIAAALKEAHSVGIVHRDLKPGNILLSGNGLVKLTDFGISRANDDVTVTKTGMIAGTPAYLAPEVAIGGDPGPESDVFSLGSTLYAATEGEPPFGLSENTLGLLHAVAAGQINPPRRSGPLASVLAVLLHPEIQHRPTAEEAEELLAAVARGETPLGGPTEEPAAGSGAGTAAASALGAGAAGAALGAAGASGDDEELPSAHSGTLGESDAPAGGFYDDVGDEDDYATSAVYPEDDYDRTRYDPVPAGGGDGTRAFPAEAGGYGAYEGYSEYGDYPEYGDYAEYGDYPEYGDSEGYGDEDGEQAVGYDEPPDEEPEERGRWKKPAIVGGVVVAALAAFGIWLFGGGGGDQTNQDRQPAQPPPAPPPSRTSEMPPPPPPTSVVSVTDEPTTTTTTTTTTRERTRTSTTRPEPTSDTGGQPPPTTQPTTTTSQTQPTTTTTTSDSGPSGTSSGP